MKTTRLAILMVAGLSLASCQSKINKNTKATEQTEQTDTVAKSVEAFEDIEIPNLDRDKVSVVDEVSKHDITIIDFWASWCRPCRAEIPTLVGIYEKYKERGLGIVGISLDSESGAWKDAINSYNMTWTQLSDLRGWDSTAAINNGVTSIPHTIVVDQKAGIIAKGLIGEDLIRFVDNYFETKDKKQ